MLYSLARSTEGTNQRIAFSIEPCGRHLATGGCDGVVRVRAGALQAAGRSGVIHLCMQQNVRLPARKLLAAALMAVHFLLRCPAVSLLLSNCGRSHPRRARVQVFDLTDGHEAAKFKAAGDTVNGVAFSPCLPLLATASGHRRYPLLPADSDSEDVDQRAGSIDKQDGGLHMSSFRLGGSCNSLRLWRLQADWLDAAADGVAGGEQRSCDGT